MPSPRIQARSFSFPVHGVPAFNSEFDFVCRSIMERLRRYTTQEACGRWNADLLDDFRADSEFMAAAEQIHVAAAQRCEQSVAPDGLSIVGAQFELAVSLSVDFRFHSLDGPCGHASAPSRLSVNVIKDSDRSFVASFGCGLREPAGAFWYPNPSEQFPLHVPEDPAGWAFFHRKKYGVVSLTDWIEDRTNGRG